MRNFSKFKKYTLGINLPESYSGIVLPISNLQIIKIVVDGDYIYIAGNMSLFTNGVSTISSRRIVRYNLITNEYDPTFDPGVVNQAINDVVVDGDYIYIAGNFSSVNGVSTPGRIAKLNKSDGSLVTDWIVSATNTVIKYLVVGETYIGVAGNFTILANNGTQRFGVLLKEDGSYVGGINFSVTPTHIVMDSNDNIYISSGPSSIGGIANKKEINKYIPGVGLDTNFGGSPISLSSTVYGMIISGNYIYGYGSFQSSFDVSGLNQLVRLNLTTGEVDSEFNPTAIESVINSIYSASISNNFIYGTCATNFGNGVGLAIFKMNLTTGEVVILGEGLTNSAAYSTWLEPDKYLIFYNHATNICFGERVVNYANGACIVKVN